MRSVCLPMQRSPMTGDIHGRELAEDPARVWARLCAIPTKGTPPTFHLRTEDYVLRHKQSNLSGSLFIMLRAAMAAAACGGVIAAVNKRVGGRRRR